MKKLNKPKKEKKPKKAKHKTDGQWVKTKKIIHERDLTCRIYAILTSEERNYLYENFPGFNRGNSAVLGVAHIEPKSIRRDLYYEPTNLVLCSWFFHFRLDNFQHPVTGEPITKEQARAWFEAARLGDRSCII